LFITKRQHHYISHSPSWGQTKIKSMSSTRIIPVWLGPSTFQLAQNSIKSQRKMCDSCKLELGQQGVGTIFGHPSAKDWNGRAPKTMPGRDTHTQVYWPSIHDTTCVSNKLLLLGIETRVVSKVAPVREIIQTCRKAGHLVAAL
jgi:hypothetical protein